MITLRITQLSNWFWCSKVKYCAQRLQNSVSCWRPSVRKQIWANEASRRWHSNEIQKNVRFANVSVVYWPSWSARVLVSLATRVVPSVKVLGLSVVALPLYWQVVSKYRLCVVSWIRYNGKKVICETQPASVEDRELSVLHKKKK